MDQPNTPSELPTDVSETKDLSIAQKITGVFFAPGSTFAQLERKPDWWVPLAMIVLVTFVFTYFVLPISLPEQMAKQEEKMEERGMNYEQIEKAMAMGEKFGRFTGLIGAAVGPGIGLVLVSLFFWFVGNVVLRGQTTFLKMFSVCTYTGLIGVLEMLIKLPLILIKKTADIQLNFTGFLSEELSETWFAEIVQALDVFAIWQYAVLAIAFTVLYKFSLTKSAWTMAILFLLSATIGIVFRQLTGT
ncbi:Yip1 family protein [Planctomycetota bacterium]